MRVRAEEIADMIDDDNLGVSMTGVDGFIIEAENDVECRAFEGMYNVALGKFTVLTFNDSDGEENYMLLNPDCEVEVSA